MTFVDQFEVYHFPRLGFIKIPKLKIPDDDIKRLGLKNSCSSEEYLIALMEEGFNKKIQNGIFSRDKEKEYATRLKLEFNEIKRLQFIDYIILVYHIIRFCKSNGILNSPSRGSCGGSLLLATLDCIKIDPLKFDLLFERFISSARTETKEIDGEIYLSSGSLPDYDLDSMRSLKYKINEFIESQFSGKSVAICNISTFQSKVILKEVYKCYEDAKEEEAKQVSNLIDVQFGKVETVEDAIKENEEFRKWAERHSETVTIAQQLNKLAKNKSVHASGIIICNENIEDCLPLELDSQKNLVCGYSMNYAQMFGVKFDNLGLKNLDAIYECLALINKKMEDIDVNHPSIYEFLNKSENFYGVFQAEDGLGKSVMRALHCQNINDLSLSIATGRPGSMKFISDIKEAKETGQRKDWGDKRINEALRNSYSVIVFQENIMKLSQVMANFTPLETNGIRKGIAKKLPKELAKWKEKFITQSLQNGFSQEICDEVWKTFEDSGNYLFCAAHAYGYGHLTAICTYLKANYPLQFYYALLKNAKHETKELEEIEVINSEMRKVGIDLLPPHILKSQIDFTLEGNAIRIGLGNIKGINAKSANKLENFKTKDASKFEVFAAADHAQLPINIVASLVLCGSLDDILIQSRSKCFLELCLWHLLTEREKIKCLELGKRFRFDLVSLVKALNVEILDDKGKPYIKDSRLNTIRKHYVPYEAMYKFNSKNELLGKLIHERELIGFSYSTNLFEIYKNVVPDLITIDKIINEVDGISCHFVADVIEVKTGKSKSKNTPYCRIFVSDHTGFLTCLAFDTKVKLTIEDIKENNGRLPKEKDIVVIRGRKRGDAVFIDALGIQDIQIYHKISQMKEIKKIDNLDNAVSIQ